MGKQDDRVGDSSGAGGCRAADGDTAVIGDAGKAVDGSMVAIEVVQGGLPRPPELATGGLCLPRGAQFVGETHLSPQASDASAPGGIGVRSGAEVVDDARSNPAEMKAQANEITDIAGTDEHDTKGGCNTEGQGDIVELDAEAGCNADAGLVGTDKHDTKVGCKSGASGCRLAGDGATRPAGSRCGKWADEEISDREGNSCAAGGGSCVSQRQLVADGDEVTKVQLLIDDIRVAAANVGYNAESRGMVREAKAALTPLIGKHRKSAKDRDCILRRQKNLTGLREAIMKM